MQRSLMAIVLAIPRLVLFIFAPNSFSQTVIDKSISAASQNDLPVSSGNYTPCCNWAQWTFEWDHIYRNPSVAAIYPKVGGTGMYLEIWSSDYRTGHHSLSGEIFTGTGQDNLEITQSGGSQSGYFSNMQLSVHYINKQIP